MKRRNPGWQARAESGPGAHLPARAGASPPLPPGARSAGRRPVQAARSWILRPTDTPPRHGAFVLFAVCIVYTLILLAFLGRGYPAAARSALGLAVEGPVRPAGLVPGAALLRRHLPHCSGPGPGLARVRSTCRIRPRLRSRQPGHGRAVRVDDDGRGGRRRAAARSGIGQACRSPELADWARSVVRAPLPGRRPGVAGRPGARRDPGRPWGVGGASACPSPFCFWWSTGCPSRS
jgi:hypothetical protein